MPANNKKLSPHCQKVLSLLSKSPIPLTAYDLLERLHPFGIKAPPTVYRALETLVKHGMVHRIESLNAFVACHDDKESVAHHARFAVCQSCDSVVEIDDSRLDQYIKALGEKLNFRIEREMLELIGLCQKCQHKHPKPAV